MSTLHTNPPDDGRDAALDDPRDLVLTASAGTGKTTMLVAKFTHVLIDKIHEQHSADAIRSLVGITFTDLAAMELKDRIRKALNKAADAEENENHPEVARALRDTVRDIDTAYIGTIHSFCRRVLQENFVAAGISPGFGVLDERDALELKNLAAFEVLRTALSPQSLDTDESPLVLAHTLGLGRLRDIVQNLHDTFRSHGIREIDIDALLAPVKALGADAEKVIAEANSLLEQMETDASAFNTTGGNKTSLKIAGKLAEAREALAPFFEEPNRIRRICLPEQFDKDSSIPGKGNMKGLDDYAAARLRFRALLNKEKSDDVTLRDLEMLDVQIEMLQTLLDLVKKYSERYGSLKERSDSLDFDDLQLQALHLLEENEQVLAHYRSAFSHIFVDEFQDVNAVQRHLVQLLRGFDATDAEQRRLFLVGDSKQSIYRFRAADVRAYNEFAEEIEKSGKRYELRLNFRSHGRLIDSFNKLFDPLFDAEESSTFQADYQQIEAGKEHEAAESPLVRIIELEKDEVRYEAWITANRIRALVEDGVPGYEREFGYGDVAILFRSTSILPQFEMELRRAGVPYAVIGGKGFHQQREVWDIAAYLNAVWFPEDDYALAAALRSPLCLVSDESLYELHKDDYGKGLLPEQPPRTDSMEDSEYERFKRFNNLLLKHRQLRDLISSAEMIDELLAETGYDAVLLAQDAGDQGAANVRKLIEMAREFEARGVGTGLEFALDLSSRLFKDKQESQASLAGAENAVKLLTVHKSKGLEFPVVILPHLSYGGKLQGGPVLYDHEVGIGMRVADPETGAAAKGGLLRRISDNISAEEDAEHLRLFYVAATRAEELLILPVSRERRGTSAVTSWLKRMEGIEALDPESAERFGICFESDEQFKQPRAQRQPLIESASGLVMSDGDAQSDETIKRFERMLARPEVQPSHRLQISVSALLGLLSDESDPDFRIEMQQLKRELEGEEEQAAAPRVVGTAIHNYLETLDYRSYPDASQIRDRLIRLGLDGSTDESVEAIQRWLASDIVGEFLANPQCRIRTEVPFVLPLKLGEEQVDVIGVIDLLAEYPDGRRLVLDFKFAHKKDNPAYRLQMQLYALAVEKSFGAAPQRVALFWLKDGVAEDVDISAPNTEKLQSEIKEALQRKRV